MKMQFEDLSKSLSLKDKVYFNLKSQIIKGILKPGERLPEEELSKAMSISRAPIREALTRLEKDGFTTIIPRKGAVVTDITEKDIHNISEIRKLLEPYAARISVKKIPAHEIDAMYAQLNKVLQNPDDFEAYMNSDLELHELLYKYLDNKILRDTLTMVKEHSLRIRFVAEQNEKNNETRTDLILQSVKEHLDILDALKLQDGEKVSELVLIHLIKAEKRSLPSIFHRE